MMERDLAYHQGTVWPFPMGALLSGLSESKQLERKGQRQSETTDGSAGVRYAGRMYRTVAGDLRRGESSLVKRVFCPGLECGRNTSGI